jgi:hypothetical protein
MSSTEEVRSLLAARAATDPDAARLLEMFTKANESLSEHSLDCLQVRYSRFPTGRGDRKCRNAQALANFDGLDC